MFEIHKIIHTSDEMQQLGSELAKHLHAADVVFFQGELGAGKTTVIRGILRAYGYEGFVKSPSYSLIELYPLPLLPVVHVDLYRLVIDTDVQNIGLSDYVTNHSILLIEWPEKAENFLPLPTVRCRIKVLGESRKVELFFSRNI